MPFFCFCANALAEFSFGKKYQVKNDVLEFETSELLIDGNFVGYVYDNGPPIRFSSSYYVYASCPTDKITGKPNGYCISWMIYDISKKAASAIALLGLGFSSEPAFHWPYVAYVQVPKQVTKDDFQNGVVKVSCVAAEWTTKNVVAKKDVIANVGHFETDAPGSFFPPRFSQHNDQLNVSCYEYNGNEGGNVISTMIIPKAK